jgi:serine protease Do
MPLLPRATLPLIALLGMAGRAAGDDASVPAAAPAPVQAPVATADEEARRIKAAVDAVYPALVRIHVVSEDGSDGRMQKTQASGSGTIISEDGYVLTNHHVAGRATRVICRLSHREELDAVVVGTDPLSDLTLLKLDLSQRRAGAPPLPVAKFGDSDALRIGDVVLAMGSPAGVSQSVTKGIVANTELITPASMGGFNLDGENVGELVRWIGHDAVIYPGNSGGPLVNLNGEIVGVNEVGIGSLGGAIPASLAREVVHELREHGSVRRSWIGLEVQPLLKSQGQERGVLVAGVLPGSPAERAGLKAGDRILTWDGDDLGEMRAAEDLPLFNRRVLRTAVGAAVQLAGVRDGKGIEWTVTTDTRERNLDPERELRGWGITVRDISRMSALILQVSNRAGAVVDSIRPGGPATQSKPALNRGDVLRSLNGVAVSNATALAAETLRLTSNYSVNVPVLVAYDRGQSRMLSVVTIGPGTEEDRPLRPDKAWFGAQTQVILPQLAEALGVEGRKGVRVTRVLPESPAEQVGVRAGDLFFKLDGQVIAASRPEDGELFDDLIRQYRVGSEAEVEGQRDGQPLRLKVTLGKRPVSDVELSEFRDDRFEFTASELSFTRRVDEALGEKEGGVLVEAVEPSGWASIAGLRPGDVILRIDGERMGGIDELRARLRGFRETKPRRVVFLVKRGVRTAFLEVEPRW